MRSGLYPRKQCPPTQNQLKHFLGLLLDEPGHLPPKDLRDILEAQEVIRESLATLQATFPERWRRERIRRNLNAATNEALEQRLREIEESCGNEEAVLIRDILASRMQRGDI